MELNKIDLIFLLETVDANLKYTQMFDDAWNSQNWETFKRHHAQNVAVYWPEQPEPKTGREAHFKGSVEFFKNSIIT
jgi:hypothetical protein